AFAQESSFIPSRKRHASSGLMGNGPKQHSVHPGRHASNLPLFICVSRQESPITRSKCWSFSEMLEGIHADDGLGVTDLAFTDLLLDPLRLEPLHFQILVLDEHPFSELQSTGEKDCHSLLLESGTRQKLDEFLPAPGPHSRFFNQLALGGLQGRLARIDL